MELCIRRFDELTGRELYEILRLRSQVFVVEQECIYQDIDGKDIGAVHVFLRDGEGIQAYLRIMDRGVSFEDVSIGRVISAKRRMGVGSRLLSEGIRAAQRIFAADRITIEAQTYAREFYEKQGFRQTSDEFLEDGIPHIQMTLCMDKGGEETKCICF